MGVIRALAVGAVKGALLGGSGFAAATILHIRRTRAAGVRAQRDTDRTAVAADHPAALMLVDGAR